MGGRGGGSGGGGGGAAGSDPLSKEAMAKSFSQISGEVEKRIKRYHAGEFGLGEHGRNRAAEGWGTTAQDPHGNAKQMWADMKAMAESIGMKVRVSSYASFHGEAGVFSTGDTIRINRRANLADQAITLAHEIAHNLDFRSYGGYLRGKEWLGRYNHNEIHAQGAAYLLAKHKYGIEQSASSAGYIARYAVDRSSPRDIMKQTNARTVDLAHLMANPERLHTSGLTEKPAGWERFAARRSRRR